MTRFDEVVARVPPHHRRAFRVMWEGSVRPFSAIANDLARPDHDLDSLTAVLCEFVTRRPLWRARGTVHERSAISQFLRRHAERGTSFVQDMITRPVKKGSFSHQILELFEADHGDIRATFELLARQPESFVCYFDKFVASVGRIAKRPEWRETPRTMFDGSFQSAVKDLLASGHKLDELSGLTNTRLDLYAWAFEGAAAAANGFELVANSRYDVAYDLGGGFTTQYLAAKFKQPLACLDLFDPKERAPHEHAVVKRQYEKEGLAFDVESVPFIVFDIFADAYPPDYETYLITSFGFLGSTPSQLTRHASSSTSDYPYKTNLHAIEGICRLITSDKDVTLCVFSRPTRTRYANICYTLRFRQRRCVLVRSLTETCHDDRFFRQIATGRWSDVLEPYAFDG